jgi:hypothetical protein
MTPLPFSAIAGEALALGLATGPVCLASCGPVVAPWLLAQPRGVGGGAVVVRVPLARSRR